MNEGDGNQWLIRRTIGYSTHVGAVLFPISMISSIHSWCDWTLSVERPMILTFRHTNSGSLHSKKIRQQTKMSLNHIYLWDMSASSVVHTGVKSPGCEKSITYEDRCWNISPRSWGVTDLTQHTHEVPAHSWNFIVPSVVSVSKSGAMLPKRRLGMVDVRNQVRMKPWVPAEVEGHPLRNPSLNIVASASCYY